MGIGGRAKCFFLNSLEQLDTLQFELRNFPFFILGGGSNLLVKDGDVESLCIKMELQGITWTSEDESFKAFAAAGVTFDELVAQASEKGIAAIQLLSGIPGSVGAAPVQNIGAYGAEVSQFIESVEVMDLLTGDRLILSALECSFSYRSSIFNSSSKNRYIILGVNFVFSVSDQFCIEHKDIVNQFGKGVALLDEVEPLRAAVMAVRHQKGMLAGSSYPKSAGSFFKNPIVSSLQLKELLKIYPTMPYFAAGEQFKLAAAWLIGQTEFQKGFRYRGVGVSPYHNLSLINVEDGTYLQLMELAKKIQQQVRDMFGVMLQIEPERVEL